MANRTVILVGATGLVGREILKGLLSDPTVAKVHCLGRRAPQIEHPKLTAHVVDFAALPSFPAADELYLALVWGDAVSIGGGLNRRRLKRDG